MKTNSRNGKTWPDLAAELLDWSETPAIMRYPAAIIMGLSAYSIISLPFVYLIKLISEINI